MIADVVDQRGVGVAMPGEDDSQAGIMTPQPSDQRSPVMSGPTFAPIADPGVHDDV